LAGYSSVIAEDVYTRTGTAEIAELFGDDRIFDFPKPSALIKELLAQATGEAQDAIVLDFFAGSATTAHAVIELNAIDNGNRRWIMVQLPEETDEKSEAYKVGYATIPEISRERIRRAGDKIAAEYPDAEVDYGFRALTIADTNYKDVYKPAGQLQQGDLLASVDNVKEDRSDLDLLYGVLTQSALELNRPIKTVEVAGATTYQYDYFGEVSGLIACFAKDVPEEAIKAIAALRPLTAVFRDSSFADSQAKVNLSEHFRILSPETKVKVI
jgi:adenine-specific DNA-methyltransferase